MNQTTYLEKSICIHLHFFSPTDLQIEIFQEPSEPRTKLVMSCCRKLYPFLIHMRFFYLGFRNPLLVISVNPPFSGYSYMYFWNGTMLGKFEWHDWLLSCHQPWLKKQTLRLLRSDIIIIACIKCDHSSSLFTDYIHSLCSIISVFTVLYISIN